jgi:uracil-DNA glycosylase family 4
MSIDPTNMREMLRRALGAQIEMGTSEMILAPKIQLPDDRKDRLISVAEAINRSRLLVDDGLGETAPADSLAHHYKSICNCQSCSLGETRNKFVYGVGNPEADLMFVGEAPGADEDRKGEPFIGRAGQLLDKIIAAIDLTREDVYIANILKCRPPGNRDPQPDEMALCMPYLREQIRMIQPLLMCALGRIAAQALLATTTPLGKLRGTFHDFEGVPMLVTYHPAALLRFQAFKKDTWADMQLLRKRYDELAGEKV